MPLIFTPEYFVEAGEVVSSTPTLIKDSTVELVAEAVPPVPAIPAVGAVVFRMFAAASPRGWMYNQVTDSLGQLAPNTVEQFRNWKPTKKGESTKGGSGNDASFPSKYATLEALQEALGSSSFSHPMTWTEVRDTGGFLTGFMMPYNDYVSIFGNGGGGGQVYIPQPDTSLYGPIEHMQFAQFPDYETEANGYPISNDAVIWGYFDFPTEEGVIRTRHSFRKGRDGFWIRDGGGDPLPAYVQEDYRTAYRIAHMVNFPGRAGIPGVPGVPARYQRNLHVGWNAGADSIEVYDGDVFVRFHPAVRVAGAVGFAMAGTRAPARQDLLTHAFYFDVDGASAAGYVVMEGGRKMTARVACADSDVFEIRREGGVVQYLVNDAEVYVSAAPSGGVLMVSTSLYCAGDGVY